MSLPELPVLPPEILENLPASVQNYIRGLEALIEMQQHIIETQLPLLQNQLTTQNTQMTELQQRLDQNSQNSSKPPSSDPPYTRPPKTAKATSTKKRGGQPGHSRHLRELLPESEVDSIQEWWPKVCLKCQRPLRPSDQLGTYQRHQVWEIERVRAKVTEHQLYTCECSGCGQLTQHPHPQTVPVGNFGPELVATLATLHGRYRISTREVVELVQDLWQVDISLGAVAEACHKASHALAPSYTQAQSLAQNSKQANVDETSWNTAGKRGWLWVAVSKVAVVFRVAAQRSRASFHALLGREYAGIVNSDRYNAYYGVASSRHQLCWAHLIRNLKGIATRAGPAEEWANGCLDLTKKLFEVWHSFQAGPQTAAERATLVAEVELIRATFQAQLAAGLSHSDAKVVTFSREVSKLEARLWLFARVAGIEPTNNAAERALRPAVIWRKTSFGTQSEVGERFVERMLTVEATCQLQRRNFLDFLAESLAATWYKQALPTLGGS